jgi:hypothetical protein
MTLMMTLMSRVVVLSIVLLIGGNAFGLEVMAYGTRPVSALAGTLTTEFALPMNYEDPKYKPSECDFLTSNPGSANPKCMSLRVNISTEGNRSALVTTLSSQLQLHHSKVAEWIPFKIENVITLLPSDNLESTFPLSAPLKAGKWTNAYEAFSDIATRLTSETACNVFFIGSKALQSVMLDPVDEQKKWTARELIVDILDQVNAKYHTNSMLATYCCFHLTGYAPGGRESFNLLVNVTKPEKERSDKVVWVEDVRPVLRATQLLSQSIAVPISYEDPPYDCDCYFDELNGRRILRGQTAIVRYKLSGGKLNSCLNAFRQLSTGEVTFDAELSRERVHVYPSHYKDVAGDDVVRDSVFSRSPDGLPHTSKVTLSEAASAITLSMSKADSKSRYVVQVPRSKATSLLLDSGFENTRMLLDNIAATCGPLTTWVCQYNDESGYEVRFLDRKAAE